MGSYLTILNISRNRIRNLKGDGPYDQYADLARFVKLRVLDLSANGMSEFPEEVKDLTHLKELRLIHNRIHKVPQSFYTSNPHNPLEIFIINNNPLQELDS